jgi:hypothetical protein
VIRRKEKETYQILEEQAPEYGGVVRRATGDEEDDPDERRS